MSDFQIGILCAMNTGLCWALLAIMLKYALHFASTGTVVWARMVFASAGLLRFVLAYGTFAEAIHRIPASTVSLITSLNPLLTLLLAWLIGYFGFTFITPEPVLWRGYAGAVLVAVGVTVAVSTRKKPLPGLSY